MSSESDMKAANFIVRAYRSGQLPKHDYTGTSIGTNVEATKKKVAEMIHNNKTPVERAAEKMMGLLLEIRNNFPAETGDRIDALLAEAMKEPE